jgi:hypothetical protein
MNPDLPLRIATGFRSRPRRLRAAAATALSVLLLAACGGSDDEPAPVASAAGAAAAMPADPAAPPVPAPPDAVLGVTQVAPADPAWLTASSPVAALPRAALDLAAAQRGWSTLVGAARCDVTLHAIVHPTVGPKGEPTDASGAVLVPSGPECPGPYPLLSYSRGTDRDRSRAMARPDDRETQAIATFFAAQGYVVVASDYLGYAQSSFPYHPYLHAESAARTNLDALRASRTLLTRLGVADSGRLFLTGYSQGGHAALATQRAIERDRPPGFVVTATGAMSGPYDLAGTVGDLALLVPLLLDVGDSSAAQSIEMRIGGLLSTGALDLLRERDSLREVLTINSVIGWRPAAPVMLCGGARDPVVPFANTTRALADFTARGATVVALDVEQEPAYRPLLPAAGVPITDLGSYHQGDVPPPCFQAVRDRLLAPLR